METFLKFNYNRLKADNCNCFSYLKQRCITGRRDNFVIELVVLLVKSKACLRRINTGEFKRHTQLKLAIFMQSTLNVMKLLKVIFKQ